MLLKIKQPEPNEFSSGRSLLPVNGQPVSIQCYCAAISTVPAASSKVMT